MSVNISTLALKGSSHASGEDLSDTESSEEGSDQGGGEGGPLIKAPFKLTLSLLEDFEAMVAYVQSPSLIFLQRLDCQAELKKLFFEIEQYCASFTEKQHQEIFQEGDFVLAQYSDEVWYRAKVMEAGAGASFHVFFIDFGNTEIISPGKMVMCPKNYLELPCQAIACSLADVPHRDSWPEEYKNVLDEQVSGRVVKVKVVHPVSKGMKRPTVRIEDKETGANVAQMVLNYLYDECKQGNVSNYVIPEEPEEEDEEEDSKNSDQVAPSMRSPTEPIVTDEKTQEVIDKAMKTGSLKQKEVVGVITGLMGAGKTTLLHHLFGMPPPGLYTSTGIAERSFRGFLHHMVRLSSGKWRRLSYNDILQFLAPLILAGMKEADVHSLASRLMHDFNTRSVEIAGSATSSDKADCTHPEANLPKTIPQKTPSKALPPPEQESPVCQKMAPLVKSAAVTGPIEDIVLELVHMIDTGGQPELMEVMPSLIHNANLALVLVDLRYSLDEYPPVTFHEKGVSHECKFPSHRYTGRDIILKLVSTLHAKKSLHEAFRLLIVATHRDCVKDDLETRVEALNSELQSLLLPAFKNELIRFKRRSKIAFVLNLNDPDDQDKDTLKLICSQIAQSGLGRELDTPTSFFVFEQDLIQFAKNDAKRDVLSLAECREVGQRLNMSNEMVEAALILFHHQNTFLYFHDVLPNHVFVEPQVPLDIVRGIVRLSYKQLQGVPANVDLLDDGIVTEEILSYDDVSPHFKKDFYEVKDAIKLFSHTLTLAPLEPDMDGEEAAPVDEKKQQYLMMCMKPAIPVDELQQHIPESPDAVPLVVKFSSGCVPLGCFGSTVSCLLSKYGWKVCRKKEGDPPKCLAHNIVSLRNPDLVNVVLVDHTQHIEIHIKNKLDSPSTTCSEIHTTVFGAIEKVFAIMHLKKDQIKLSPAVVCSCGEVKGHHHATFVKLRSSDKYYLDCLGERLKPSEKQLWWMGSATANTRPTLPQLMRLNIPERVGVACEKFGYLLLDDKNGDQVAIIKEDSKHQTETIVTRILRKWIRESPTPATWDNLIAVLRNIKLSTLADDVKKHHQEILFC